jgi:DNA-binding protein YbaB
MTSDEKKEFKQLIKEGTLEAFKSEEGKEVFLDYFAEAFHEVVAPVLEDHDKRISRVEKTINI